MANIENMCSSEFDGKTRTKVVKHHISLTFFYKALAISLNYLLVPLTINYLDIEQYGIWMTLLSIMSWFAFFDIGLGNGLRNRLTEAVAVNDIKLAKTYVSTAYIVIIFISIFFFVIMLISLPLINWTKVFNTTSIYKNDLLKVVFVVGFFFLLNLVLSLCNHMFYAFQEASLASIRPVLLNFIALILITILIFCTSGKLLYLGVCYGISMTASNFALIYYFFKRHREVIPSLHMFDLNKIREIGTLGVKFFITQIAVLVIFATDNLIISQVQGPSEVTPYNIIFKLFSIITFGYSIINTPIWSAYTNAYKKNDVIWLQNTFKKVKILMIPIIFFVFILVLFCRGIVDFWIGPRIHFSLYFVILMGVYIIIQAWSSIHATFVNGIGEIKIQMYSSILAGFVNIPLSIYFAKYLNMGISGVLAGSIISMSFFAIIGPIQIHYFFKR